MNWRESYEFTTKNIKHVVYERPQSKAARDAVAAASPHRLAKEYALGTFAGVFGDGTDERCAVCGKQYGDHTVAEGARHRTLVRR